MYCTGLALFLKSDYWAFELSMHCMVLLLIINSHHRLFKLDSSLFMHSSDLKRILHHHFFKFQFCQISILLVLCIAQTLLTVLTVIIAHPSSILLIYAVHRPCSYFSESLVRILAVSARLMNSTDLAFTLNIQYCTSELNSAF